MAARPLAVALGYFKRQLAAPPTGEWSDRQLLARFARQRDEMAFAYLVRRHGPLVLGVGRRILRHDQDAEDVFQATFLILARKAASAGWPRSLAGWLYRVAYRLALRTRARIARQRQLQKEAASVSTTEVTTSEDRPELYRVLDEELQRLSEPSRQPLLLCYLAGKTRDQAAQELGWSLRTLERRLAKGLGLLRLRLSKRGLELPAALLVVGLSQQAASANVSAAAVSATVEAAMTFGSGPLAGGTAISASTLALAKGGLKAMAMTRIRYAALALVLAIAAAAGIGLLSHRLPADQQLVDRLAVEEKTVDSQAAVWPEGTTVTGRVVDHKGTPVANAEVLMLGEERIIVDADRRTWFVPQAKENDPAPPSTRTNAKGEFAIERKKGAADRLVVIAEDPLFWIVSRKNLARADRLEIQLPASGSLTIHCDLPGKAAKQPVEIDLRSGDGLDSTQDLLRFHFGSSSVTNPGEAVFDHLPPGQYAVQRYQETPTGKNSTLMTDADRQLAKVEPQNRATVRFERKVGRPLTGQVRGLEKIDLRYANVSIMYAGPEEQLGPDGHRGRLMTGFDVIPIASDGRFTTDPIPPGKYHLWLFAVRSSSLESSSQESDFDGQLEFTVPEKGDLPRIEVVAKPRAHKAQLPDTDNRMRVVDEAGKPVASFQAMLHTADAGWTGWMEGRAGLVGLGHPGRFRDAEALDVLVRADGYAPAVARFTGDQRNQLRQGEATMMLRRGARVEVRFRLPEGLAWPGGLLPEAYFDDYQERVRPLRQPVNRENREKSDFNMLNIRPVGPGRFELRLAADTPPFHLAIHAPGFLQCFETGPLRLADARGGILEILVPRPAGLDIRFDPAVKNLADAPFKGAFLEVMWRIPGTTGSYLDVATRETTSASDGFKLTDLAPGTYHVSVGTRPKRSGEKPPGDEINPGAFHDAKELRLEPGQSASVRFHYQPLDPNAFRGQRTALLHIRLPDGTPAKGRRVKVGYYDGHYGYLDVFSGTVPESGTLSLKNLTDRVVNAPSKLCYKVTIDDELLGSFGFRNDKPAQEFEFRLAPRAGDPAPDVELLRIGGGPPARLSSLRGKVVCLEFWATWCGPCQPAMAKLTKLAEERSPGWEGRVAIVPMSVDARPEAVQSHIAQRSWDRLQHYWAGAGTTSDFDAPAARAFVVSGVPQAILIGADGRILWRGHPLDNTGGQSLKSRIEAALKK